MSAPSFSSSHASTRAHRDSSRRSVHFGQSSSNTPPNPPSSSSSSSSRSKAPASKRTSDASWLSDVAFSLVVTPSKLLSSTTLSDLVSFSAPPELFSLYLSKSPDPKLAIVNCNAIDLAAQIAPFSVLKLLCDTYPSFSSIRRWSPLHLAIEAGRTEHDLISYLASKASRSSLLGVTSSGGKALHEVAKDAGVSAIIEAAERAAANDAPLRELLFLGNFGSVLEQVLRRDDSKVTEEMEANHTQDGYG